MKYRLLAIDIDGTLLNHERVISPRVQQAVKAANAAGCIVTLATGRRHREARRVANELGLDVPLIMYCGSIIYDTATNHALYHKPLKPEFIRRAVSVILEVGFQPVVLQSPLQGEHIYLGPVENDDDYLREYAENNRRADLISRISYSEMMEVAEALTVVAIGRYTDINLLHKTIGPDFDCQIFNYVLTHKKMVDLHGFDFVQPGVGKGVALAELAAHFGLDLSQTVAIGDSQNDVDMLTAAGLGIAMGNAPLDVQQQAKVVVGTNRDDGVAEAIERFILER
jgi:Cof subfamily protein (haloacid dehalogenase superfamily)